MISEKDRALLSPLDYATRASHKLVLGRLLEALGRVGLGKQELGFYDQRREDVRPDPFEEDICREIEQFFGKYQSADQGDSDASMSP